MGFNRTPLESNLVSKVKRYLKETFKHDQWALNTSGNASQKSGTPDIIICLKGHYVAIELKREDGSGVISNQQKIVAEQLKRAGADVLISHDFEEIKNFLNTIAFRK